MSEKAHKSKLKSAIAIALTAICVCTVLISIGVSPLWAVQPGVVPETGLLENYITVEVEGTIIHYQKQSFWNESEFSAILENKEEFKNAVIHDFDEKILKYHERGEYAVGADVEFDETKKATVLKCDIHGAIRESDGEYYATFKWLLVPLRLDFIDDNFDESKEGLSWDGEVDGIPTNIIVKLPPQEYVYEAWERLPSPGHCHGHVWWTMPVPLPSPVITPTPAPPGFEAIFAIAGILAVVYLLRKRE
ncbi:MAG: PGF-CTERM sorting domain-containing protein [Euryarchaeota archaeon]|nr:PGF-CTERM sorting domain-containing protein [Euryarchaeota archaeon]